MTPADINVLIVTLAGARHACQLYTQGVAPVPIGKRRRCRRYLVPARPAYVFPLPAVTIAHARHDRPPPLFRHHCGWWPGAGRAVAPADGRGILMRGRVPPPHPPLSYSCWCPPLPLPTLAARQPQKSRGKGGFSPQGLRCHGSAALRPLKRPHPCFFAAEEYLSFLRSLWAFCAWLAYPFRFISRGGVLCDVTGTVTRHMAAVVGRLGFCPLALSVRSYVSPSFNALAPASRRPLYALMLLLLVPAIDTMRHFAPAFIVLRSRRGLPAARLFVFTVGSVARARAFITSALLPPLPAPLFRRL